MTNETITFTAINPNDEHDENRIIIEVTDEKTFVINGTPIDAQQMGELGMLFFSLAARAGIDDLDSCNELLDGFDIKFPENQLVELVNIERKANET